jgi:hypothetical protein
MKPMSRAPAALLFAMFLPATLSDSQSGPLARELTGLMISHQLGAVAARDSDTPDRFVAALLFPDVQLLVVSARYAAPALLQEQLARKEYQEIYAALQQAAIADSKVFFQDLKADGLHAKPEGAVHVLYEHVVHQTMFDGNPAKQMLTDAAYAEKFAAADALYSRLLALLIGELNGTSRHVQRIDLSRRQGL